MQEKVGFWEDGKFFVISVLIYEIFQIGQNTKRIKELDKYIKSEISQIKEEFDVHRKIFKLEKDMEELKEKMSLKYKRGFFDPTFILVIAAIILIVVFFITYFRGG